MSVKLIFGISGGAVSASAAAAGFTGTDISNLTLTPSA